MDATQKFVAELNVLRFMERLGAPDCDQRQLWTELLLAEIEKFDSPQDRKNVTEKCLDHCRAGLARGRERMKTADANLPESLILLRQLEELEEVHRVIADYLGSLRA